MTKTSKVIEAAQRIEKDKKGFTVPELMSTLNWKDNQKQFVQNIMFILTKKGQAIKLTRTRPVLYSLNTNGKKSTSRVKRVRRDKTAEQIKMPAGIQADLSAIPLRTIEAELSRRNRELERKIHKLEKDLIKLMSQKQKKTKRAPAAVPK